MTDDPKRLLEPSEKTLSEKIRAEAATLKVLAGVMDELQTVIAAENDHLARGLPASVLDTTERKAALSQEYGALGKDLAENAQGPVLDDPSVQENLLQAAGQLYAMSEQNRQLLTEALEATRRRVDRVMDAIRFPGEAESKIPGAPTKRSDGDDRS